MGVASEKRYPVNLEDYKLYEEVGEGVSATVYRALCLPLNETVAIKVLDLEKCNNDLDGIRREVQTLNLIDHPNVLRACCSFSAGPNLWVVMPYMAVGSCLHIMKSGFPDGFEEPIIAKLLREVLQALVYLHAHGHIHRDVKAGNILIDSNGAVKLADFGVSACMFDTGDRQRSRNTFVGTPCWMAPEVMQQLHGYDFKADIWSFGITALELAHGHAPFSKYPPMKVLLMTLQNAPPGLDYERDKKFSKYFKALVAACLVKDPKKRPTAEKLLKHSFFNSGCSNEYLVRKVLRNLSPLGDRFRSLKNSEADLLLHNKGIGDKEHLSQQEYIRGISGWNFNTEDLKAQASLIQDVEGISNMDDFDVNSKQRSGSDDVGLEPEKFSPESSSHSSAVTTQEDELIVLVNATTSFSSSPLKAFKCDSDASEDDTYARTPKGKDVVQSPRIKFPLQPSPRAVDKETRKNDEDYLERSSSVPGNVIFGEHNSSLTLENALSPSRKANGNGGREHVLSKHQPVRNFSSNMLYAHSRDSITSVEDISEAVVQCKGRFKVTSEDLSSKDASTTFPVNSGCGNSPSSPLPAVAATSILSALDNVRQLSNSLMQQTSALVQQVSGLVQQVDYLMDEIPKFFKTLKEADIVNAGTIDPPQHMQMSSGENTGETTGLFGTKL